MPDTVLLAVLILGAGALVRLWANPLGRNRARFAVLFWCAIAVGFLVCGPWAPGALLVTAGLLALDRGGWTRQLKSIPGAVLIAAGGGALGGGHRRQPSHRRFQLPAGTYSRPPRRCLCRRRAARDLFPATAADDGPRRDLHPGGAALDRRQFPPAGSDVRSGVAGTALACCGILAGQAAASHPAGASRARHTGGRCDRSWRSPGSAAGSPGSFRSDRWYGPRFQPSFFRWRCGPWKDAYQCSGRSG